MLWEFTTHEQLVAAGWTWRGEGYCREPKCGARILWYTNPDRHRIPIDPGTYQLHFIGCRGRAAAREANKNVIEFPSGGHRQRHIDFDDAP